MKINKTKIVFIIGARPNFIKIAPLIKEAKRYKNIKQILIHTGQHYDWEMSKIFLKELKISDPATHFVLPRLPKWEKGDQARELRFFLAGLGLPQIRFHDLRATTCSLLLARDVPIFKVMAMLGWKDLKTASIYLRMSGETIRGITDGFDLHDPNVALNGDLLYLRNKK